MSHAVTQLQPTLQVNSRRSAGRWHHTGWKAITFNGGSPETQRVIYLCQPGKPDQLFTLFSKFVWARRGLRRLSWQQDAAHAVGCLIDFFIGKKNDFAKATRQDAFEAFARALRFGTMDADRSDPSGLYWDERSPLRAQRILAKATEFSDWLASSTGTEPLNPWRKAFPKELILKAWRAHRRANTSLLGHVSGFAEAPRKGLVRSTRVENDGANSSVLPNEVPETFAFDPDRFNDLLTIGFAVRPMSARVRAALCGTQGIGFIEPAPFDVRNAMIAILQLGAGLRLGEAFHLYVSDVQEDPRKPGHAQVRLYHPSAGAPPDDEITHAARQRGVSLINRETYLRFGWKLRPRHLEVGGYRAAWKNLALTAKRGKFAEVFFFRPEWAAVFLRLYRYYITYIRPRNCSHPFLFATEHGKRRGCPYTVGRYRIAFANAVKRIGLDSSRYEGTTPHGLRHAYGQALAWAGMKPEEIQACLHHTSIESQRRYTAVPPAQVSDALNAAAARLDRTASEDLAHPSLTLGDWLQRPALRGRR